MKITFDPVKNERNIVQRGLSFDRVIEFDFETAKVWQDTRQRYSESRVVALGYLGTRLHVLVFCETDEGIRVISFRKANPREGVKHGFALTRD
ncbi:BrnT family toxin [Rhodoferax sp.]|uniref:BrnT family toxin n=1 Tax=Rhodoferax sp. TaxID=50421 RepID=UPI001A0F36F5|nr:BrnT family toxin [Rhodoferax sp.]MBE0475312.1 BrnT family toxin [Rhodoferax sp.]